MVTGVGLKIPQPPKPVPGDFYSPFFRVKFFRSLTTVSDFERDRAREIIRESKVSLPGSNNRSPMAFKVPKQPPVESPDDFANNQINDRTDQRELDSRRIEDFVESLEVVLPAEGASQATVTLTPPYEAAVAILEERLIAFGSLMLIEFGYADPTRNDIVSGPYLFRLNDPSATFADTISITLHGQDVMSHDLQRAEAKRSWARSGKQGQSAPSGGFFPTDFKIIEALVKQLNLELDITNLNRQVSPLFKVRESDRDQKQSDWAFFKQVLKENLIGFYIVGRSLYLYDFVTTVINKEPVYRLLYRAALTEEYDVPLISFSAEARRDLFHARQSRDFTKVCTDRDTGVCDEEIIESQNPGGSANVGTNVVKSDTSRNRSSASPLGDVKSQAIPKGQTGTVISGSHDDEHLRSRIQYKAGQGGALAGVTATLSTLGLPGILPQDLVILDGLPDFYRGVYVVTAVTHQWGQGATTEMTVVRNGSLKPNENTETSRAPSKESHKTGQSQEKPRLEDGR